MRVPILAVVVAGALVVVVSAGIVSAFVVHDDSSERSVSAVKLAPSPSSAALPSATATPTPSPSPTATTPATAVPTPAAPAPVARPPATAAPITYVVKPGDTLSDIAAWFALHGYAGLYDANKAVIGANPSLIRPGQTFTIVEGLMRTG